MAASKRLLWSSFERNAPETGTLETNLHRTLMNHPDAREAMRAYLEDRPPHWTGHVDQLPR